MKLRTFLLGAVAAMTAGTALGQTGYTITGGLSNFDCHNRCDLPCNEFEIEIEGIRPEDVLHTYHNSNYGSPLVLLSTDGSFTIIDYRNPQHLTPVGQLEHFGVSLRQLGPNNTIRVRWMRDGQPATVNGQVPAPGGGSAPATQPAMPTVSAEMAVGSTGADGVSLCVTNNDATQAIWIRRRVTISQGVVSLESLMRGDPVVTTTTPIDAVPLSLAPGQSVTLVSDLIEVEDNQSAVFAAEYYQDLLSPGPFNQTHQPGPLLGNVMTATLTSPDAGCGVSMPTIITQPTSASADEGRSVNLRINADGNDLPLSYQWMKEGQPLVNGGLFHGVTTDELSIDEVNASTEGFYTVRVTNACGSVTSRSALVFITGHNIMPAPLGASAVPDAQQLGPGDVAIIDGACALTPPGSTFQWKRNGQPIANGPAGASPDGGVVTGAFGAVDAEPMSLMIEGLAPSDAGVYTLVVTNGSGQATSNQSVLLVAAAPVGCSPADVATDGSSDPLSGPDGFITGTDFDVFILAFFTELTTGGGTPLADLTDDTGSGGPDGFVTGTDFDLFVQLFFVGC
ncbi:MAG: immunoglobulin domain-containing protein [Phycisphaeraceae bacterium]|nr:immunoglobulin domain-containing protein [Phycisphaeraceae bacterium]